MSSTTCFTEAELHRCTTYMYSCFNIACILCVASHIVSSLLTHSPFLHSSLNMHITMCILIMRNVWAIVLCSLLFCRFCDYFIPHCRGSIWSVSTYCFQEVACFSPLWHAALRVWCRYALIFIQYNALLVCWRAASHAEENMCSTGAPGPYQLTA